MTDTKQSPCQTIHGTHEAYSVEWRPDQDSKWRGIPTFASPIGVPPTGCAPGVNKTIGLLGHKEAMALAWGFAAQADKEPWTEVRVSRYSVIYNIEATRQEDTITIGNTSFVDHGATK